MHRQDLLTADGVRLAAWHHPATSGDLAAAVVLAHGFGGGSRRPEVAVIAAGLQPSAGVLSVDLRGHGRSAGRSTLGEREVLDVDCGVRAARALGYRSVATLGFSMGGAAVLRHAAGSVPGGVPGPALSRPEAVVAVSTASRWFVRDTPAMRRLHWLVLTRTGRLTARVLLRTRVSADGWDVVPESPGEVVDRIAPIPLLLVHGEADRYFSTEHAHLLRAAAGEPVTLWVEPGFGHAEVATTPELVARIGDWLAAALGGVVR